MNDAAEKYSCIQILVRTVRCPQGFIEPDIVLLNTIGRWRLAPMREFTGKQLPCFAWMDHLDVDRSTRFVTDEGLCLANGRVMGLHVSDHERPAARVESRPNPLHFGLAVGKWLLTQHGKVVT